MLTAHGFSLNDVLKYFKSKELWNKSLVLQKILPFGVGLC